MYCFFSTEKSVNTIHLPDRIDLLEWAVDTELEQAFSRCTFLFSLVDELSAPERVVLLNVETHVRLESQIDIVVWFNGR